MTFIMLFIGLLPILFLPDFFDDGSDDDTGNGTGGDDADFPVDTDDVLFPDEGDDTPPDPPIVLDDFGVLPPDESDDLPGDYGDPIGDDDVQDPNDTAEEEYYIDGDGTLLQQLLDEQSDATTGRGYLGTQIQDTSNYELGDGEDTFGLDDDGIEGNGEGELGFWDGTPVIETDGDLNVVSGGDGDDTITSGDEAAYIFGGAGDDNLAIGDGAAAVYGGIGEDIITGSDVITEDGAATAYLDGGDGDDLIVGGDGNEVIAGGEHGDEAAAGDDILYGGGGDDIVRGGYGADVISGGTGDDVIDHLGRADEQVVAEQRDFGWHIDNDADSLDAGEGNDTLIFDRADTATGGEGNDTFWLYHDSSSGVGHAEITDFTVGEDFLRISLNPDIASGTPEISVAPSEDGNDGIVTVNGEVVAVLQGTPGASAADVYVDVPQNIFG